MPNTIVNHGIQYYCTVGRPPERGSASPVTHDQHQAGTREDLPTLTQIYNQYIENTAITIDKRPFTVATLRPWFDQFHPGGAASCY